MAEADEISKLTVDDPRIVKLIQSLQSCNLFDDPSRETEIQITLADLHNILRIAHSSDYVADLMAKWEGEQKRFISLDKFVDAVRDSISQNGPDKPQEQPAPEAKENEKAEAKTEAKTEEKAEEKGDDMQKIVSDLEKTDRCFPQVVEILTTCHMFDDVPNGSIDISVDDLMLLLHVAKGGRYLVSTLQALAGDASLRVMTVGELTELVKTTSKKIRKEFRRQTKVNREKRSQAREKVGHFGGEDPNTRSSLSEASTAATEGATPLATVVGGDEQQASTPAANGVAAAASPVAPSTSKTTEPSTSSPPPASNQTDNQSNTSPTTKPTNQRTTLAPGGSFTHVIKVSGASQKYFKEMLGYDVSFEVRQGDTVVKEATRCVMNKGTFETKPGEDCEVSFVWGNEYSWMNSKDVEWCIFVFGPEEQERRAEEEQLSHVERDLCKKIKSSIVALAEREAPVRDDLRKRKEAAEQALREAERVYRAAREALDQDVQTAAARVEKDVTETHELIGELQKLGRGNPDRFNREVETLISEIKACASNLPSSFPVLPADSPKPAVME